MYGIYTVENTMKIYMPKSNPPPRIQFSKNAPITDEVVRKILDHYKYKK